MTATAEEERPVLRNRWIAELRSGKYPQGKNALHRPTSGSMGQAGYCCLGVVCEMLVRDGELKKDDYGLSDTNDKLAVYSTLDGSDLNSVFLPRSVASKLGIDSSGTFTMPLADLGWVYQNMGAQVVDIVMEIDQDDPTGLGRHSRSGIRLTLAALNDAGVSFDNIATFIEKYL